MVLAAGYAASLAVFAVTLPAATDTPPARTADAIVALTGGTDRVDTALRLLAEDAAPILLVSGAHPGTDLSRTLRRVNADPSLGGRVVLGSRARSTRGNALEAASFARDRNARSLIVVTSVYHMPRALLEFGNLLPDADLLPYPVAPPGGTPVGLLLSEHAKWLAVAVGITRLLPARNHLATPDPAS